MSKLLTNDTGRYFPQWYLKFATDGSQQAWASTGEVNTTIPIASRTLGLTVLIGAVEYWYRDSTADVSLIPKVPVIPPPVPSRFGVAGEDAVATENRNFSATGFQFHINDSSSFRVRRILGTQFSEVSSVFTGGVQLSSSDSGVFNQIIVTPTAITLDDNANSFENFDPTKFLTTDTFGRLTLANVPTPPAAGWLLTGNLGTTAGTNFLGTTDNQDMVFKTLSNEKVRLMAASDEVRISGSNLTINAGPLAGNLTGGNNIAIAPFNSRALTLHTKHNNVAIGAFAAEIANSGASVFIGNSAGRYITFDRNVAIGFEAMRGGIFGDSQPQNSVAIGNNALTFIQSGNINIAIGEASMEDFVSGNANIGLGTWAIFRANGASENTAVGFSNMSQLANGGYNVSVGNIYGTAIPGNASENIVIGAGSWGNGNRNIVIGTAAGAGGGMGGQGNILIGYGVYTTDATQSSCILIGPMVRPVNSSSGQLNIGNVLYGKGMYDNYATQSNVPTVNGSISIGIAVPTARLHLPAGDAGVGMAPLKINQGIALTLPENGTIEYHSDHLWFTTSAERWQLDRQALLLRPVAGTVSPNTAPLKFTAGPLNTVPENGTVEFDGTNIYYTTLGTRKLLGTNQSTLGFNASNDGGVITTGIKKYVIVPYDCVITGWSIVGDVPGSIVVDVWADPAGIPTVADSITGTQKPTITLGNQFATSTDVSTWSTVLTANTILAFNIDSVNTLSDVTLIIKINHA